MVYIHKITSSIFKQPIHWHTFLEFFGRFHVNSSNGHDAKTLTGAGTMRLKTMVVDDWTTRFNSVNLEVMIFRQKGPIDDDRWVTQVIFSCNLVKSPKGFWLSRFSFENFPYLRRLTQVSRWGLWRGAMEDPPEVWGFWMDGSVFGETLRFVGHTAHLEKGNL